MAQAAQRIGGASGAAVITTLVFSPAPLGAIVVLAVLAMPVPAVSGARHRRGSAPGS